MASLPPGIFRPALRAWRYLEPDHADAAMMLGTFRIGTAEAFAVLEDAQQDGLDSAIERRFDHHFADSDADPEGVALAESLGARITHCRDFTLHARVTTRSSKFHVLCLGDRPDNEYLLSERKTAVVEITDLEAFFWFARAAYPQLGPGRIGRVTYGPTAFDARSPSPPPSPFLKGERFRREGEIRIVWNMLSRPGAAVNLVIPQAIPLLRRVR